MIASRQWIIYLYNIGLNAPRIYHVINVTIISEILDPPILTSHDV